MLNFNVDPQSLGDQMESRTLLKNYTVDQLYDMLHTSIDGISPNIVNIENRKKHFGQNFIPPKMPHSYFYYLFKAFQDFMLIFLFIGGIFVFIVNMVREPETFGIEGLSIILAVVIIVLVSSVNDYSKELKFKDLHKTIKLSNTCTVIRNAQVSEISTVDLVVGDIYLPKYGDQVPADSILIKNNDLKVEESALTGESELSKKDPINNPYLLASTHVMDGSGTALVISVGIYSQTGRILKLLGASKKRKDKKDEEDPKCRSILQEKLTKLALMIGKIGVCAGILVFLIEAISHSMIYFQGNPPAQFKRSDLFHYVDFLLQGFTVVVVSVPEGLPLAVTLALAFSVMRMLKDKNLVRQLYSCETMGNATTICSDKTGTLTTNRMTVVSVFVNNNRINDLKTVHLDESHKRGIVQNICINKSASSCIKIESNGISVQLGNKTDCALLGFVHFLNVNTNVVVDFNVLKIYPFNSEKKLMSVVISYEGKFRILVKGAPDVLLAKCKLYYLNQQIVEFNHSLVENIKNNINLMANEALRTIILAHKDFDSFDPELPESNYLDGLVFLCLAGIEDPVRSDVPDAIRMCKKAGIVVRMVTGDNIHTAKSIALKCGILSGDGDDLILDSTKFNHLIHKDGKFNQELFDKVWPKLKVLARSTPKDKYILVNGIINTKLKKQVVAVTGDGTNDAPALKRADVGFAMGLTGTDIAKEACDIIITDDNFSNIINAILWGRNVYDSISKFLIFQLTVNTVAITMCIIYSIVYYNIFYCTQLLWVNLVMDTFASLALATDKPTNDLLNRKPYSRNKSLLSRYMVMFILLHSLYQILILLLLTFFGSTWFSIDFQIGYNMILKKNNQPLVDNEFATFIFNVFVFMQIFNEINARKVHGERNVFQNILQNKIFIGIFILTCFAQTIIIQFGSKWFHVVPISFELWLWTIFIGSTVLLYHQIVVVTLSKYMPIPKRFRIQKGISSSVVMEEQVRPIDPQLLWIRGLKKLQTQLRVIHAFKQNLDVPSNPHKITENEMDEKVEPENNQT